MTNENNLYSIFEEQCFNLAETIVIKSDYSARYMNNALINSKGDKGFDALDRKTWKYYKHLAGDYYHTDVMMYVESLDTMQTIEFTKENLSLHRTTAREYTYGTQLYKELVVRYPEQEELILGILYPIDYETSINAEEFSIIGYPRDFVETNEVDLIPLVENTIKNIYTRWFNKVYIRVEERYAEGFFAQLYLLLPAIIIKTRLDLAKTMQAHSYHVRNYLASNLALDKYYDLMNFRQRMWFYFNVKWVDRNAGSRKTFDILKDVLMNWRSLALTEFNMKHDISSILQDKAFVSSEYFERKGLNRFVSIDYLTPLTTSDILNKEDELARGNPGYKEEFQEDISFSLQHSLSNKVGTKTLESGMYDYSDATPFPLTDILVNHWPYLANLGIYNTYIRIINPTSGELISLDSKKSWILAQYFLLRSAGVELEIIPPVVCRKIQRIPFPNVKEILSYTSGKWKDIERYPLDEKYVLDLTQYNPKLTSIISTEDYYNRSKEIFTALNYQRAKASLEEHWEKRGEVAGMAASLYGVYKGYMEDPNKTYTDWFEENNINIDDFHELDYEEYYKDITEQILGLDLNTTNSLKSVQTSMIGIYEELSSYSIQFLKYINDGQIKIWDWPVIRFGDINASTKSHAYFIELGLDFFDLKAKSKHLLPLDVANGFRLIDVNDNVKADICLPIPRQFLKEDKVIRIYVRYLSNSPLFFMDYDRSNTSFRTPLPGLKETFDSLTPEQQRSLPDIYNTSRWTTN